MKDKTIRVKYEVWERFKKTAIEKPFLGKSHSEIIAQLLDSFTKK